MLTWLRRVLRTRAEQWSPIEAYAYRSGTVRVVMSERGFSELMTAADARAWAEAAEAHRPGDANVAGFAATLRRVADAADRALDEHPMLVMLSGVQRRIEESTRRIDDAFDDYERAVADALALTRPEVR